MGLDHLPVTRGIPEDWEMRPGGSFRGDSMPQNTALISQPRAAATEVRRHGQSSPSILHRREHHRAAQLSSSSGNPLCTPSHSIECPRGSVLAASTPS